LQVFGDTDSSALKSGTVDDHDQDEKKRNWDSEPHEVGCAVDTFENGEEAEEPDNKCGSECSSRELACITIFVCFAVVIVIADGLDHEELFGSRGCCLIAFPFPVWVLLAPGQRTNESGNEIDQGPRDDDIVVECDDVG
jgi:hypothetical protein